MSSPRTLSLRGSDMRNQARMQAGINQRRCVLSTQRRMKECRERWRADHIGRNTNRTKMSKSLRSLASNYRHARRILALLLRTDRDWQVQISKVHWKSFERK